MKLSSSRVHLPRSFAVLIQILLIWLLLSVKFLVSSSFCLRNSLMSSSHFFLGLPIDLFVLYFELNSGFMQQLLSIISHSMIRRFSSQVSISIFLGVMFQHFIFSFIHFFHNFIGAPFDIFNPIFFFDLCGHSRIIRHCPGHCEIFRFFRFHFRRRSSSSRCRSSLRWS